MARARASSPPARSESVRLPPVISKGIVVAILLLVVGAALWRFNSINNRLQAERRLRNDPVLSRWFATTQEEIGEFERTEALAPVRNGPRMAEAVWLGTVSHRELDAPANQRPALIAVTLAPAYLLAGRPSLKDPRSESVQISVRQFAFPQGEPQRGEQWAFSVSRINGGNNIVRDAHPLR